MPRITMADVAKEAGVNKATVSRALKGDGRISPSTREKVWEASRKLGYRVHMGAQALSSRRTSLVGVAMDDLGKPWAGQFLSGAEKVLSRHKVEMVVKELGLRDISALTALRRLLDRRIDGVIWISSRSPEGLLDVPSVVLGQTAAAASVRVLYDEEGISKRVMKAAKGRSIKYLKGPGSLFPFLSKLQGPSGPGEFLLYDGDLPVSGGSLKGDEVMICSDPLRASALGCMCLDWMSIEAGAVSARAMMNLTRSKGMRPSEIRLLPSIYDQNGSIVLD